MTSPPIHRPIPGFRPLTPPVTAETIDEVLRENQRVAIHFWAEWNGVDPPMDEAIRQARAVFPDVFFASCNVDLPENRTLCDHCGVNSIPCLAVFVDGEQRRLIIGLRTPHDLPNELKERLAPTAKAKWWQVWLRRRGTASPGRKTS